MAGWAGARTIPCRLIFRQEADADLSAIAAHTQHQFGDRQAQAYGALIRAVLDRVAEAPASFPKFEPLPPLRSAKAGVHRIYFMIEGEGEVHVVRVLHSRMDTGRHLR